MKLSVIIILLSVCLIACSTTKTKSLENFSESDCKKHSFGKIDTKRLLSEEDKKKLAGQGVHIQEFVFENQYLGTWETKWNKGNLEKTPINALTPFKAQDKLASGMRVQDLEKLSNTPGESMVLIQTMTAIDSGGLSKYGEVVFSRDHSYRMVVPHNKLMELLDFPCLRLLNIIKYDYVPDN